MTYNEWEDRGMYAPPMFAMVESGMSSAERLTIAMATIYCEDFDREISKTFDAFPISTREHATGKNARWAIQSTLYRLHGITTRETDEVLKRMCEEDRNDALETADTLLRKWAYEHPSD